MGKKSTKEVVNDKIFDTIADSGLTQQEQDFILYYLESNNITQSYLKAYNTDKKYANIKGYEVYHKPKVQSEIKKLKKILRIGHDIDPSRYVEVLQKVALADIGDYIKFSEEEVPVILDDGTQMVDPDTGTPITKKINRMHLSDSNKVDTSIINEIKQGRDGISIKLMDKMKALEKLKEFFEWRAKENKVDKADNNIIEAINSKSEETWDDVDTDLKELYNEDK